MPTQSALSTEYLRYPVSAVVNGVAINPTTDVVQFAFPLTGVAPSTWLTGSWETVSSTYFARVLVGPTGGVFAPSAGVTYDVWVKITDAPEVPVRKVGTLTAT